MDRSRRRDGDGGGDDGGADDGGADGGWTFPPAGETPWRRWVVISAVLFGILILLGFLGGIVNLVTDLMWYDALGLRDVLTTRLWAQVGLFVVGFVAYALPALVSIWIARRIAPQAKVHRLSWLDLPDASRAITLGLSALAILFALGSGGAWAANWEQILVYINGEAWGVTDPTLGRDVGFYVFDLPVLRFVQGWAVTSLVVIGLMTLGAYAAGALQWQFRLTAPVRAHLSIVGALLLIAISGGYQLDIADLAYSTRGVGGGMQAALYTDVNAQLPAFVILTFVALVAALLLLLNTWFRTLWLLGAAVVGWFVISILVGGLYPTFVQRVQVDPNELAVEQPYIRNHLEATRAAFDLDDIETRRFTGDEPLSRPLFEENQATIDNLRLWDYRPLLTTFGQQQILRFYYTFTDVDIDRYEIDGEQRQIMLSGRELDVELFGDNRTWTNERLVYTHGYGLTAVPVDAVTAQGEPDYLVSGIDPDPRLPIGEPRIYFGQVPRNYVVTGTDTAEFDFPIEERDEDATTTWQGTTGVSVGNPINRLLFALRFGDFNLLISGQLTDASQILFRREIQERVPEIAPFLFYDGDPYLVSADGRLAWIWDGYTVSPRYPNAQPLPAGSRFAGANYMRNSVKVVVDAYDGSARFFVADPDDPIVAAYARIFPTMFEPLEAMPEALISHLRYPEDLFRAQNEMFLRYHLPATDAGARTLYNRDDRWALPEDPSTGTDQLLEAYYVTMVIPGEGEPEFALIQPFVPEGRRNMIAWVAARMDPGAYGERIAFQFPAEITTQGPAQIQARIEQNTTISQQFTLWEGAGSRVIRGNLLVLPLGDSLLYAQPIFLQSEGAPFPEFVRIILVGRDRVAFGETIDDAIRQVLGEAPLPPPQDAPPDGEPGEPGEPGELPADVAGLVVEAQRLYDAAQQALADGDLGAYQRRINELASVLEALADLTGVPVEPAPEPEPEPSP